MDAQNAVEPASTKPAASPKRPGSDSDQSRPLKLSSGAKPDLSSKDRRQSASASNANDDDGTADGNSDAETIVLPGKDSHSPSKVRKIIKREDKSDTEDVPTVSRARKPDANGKRERDGDKGDRPEKKEKSVSLADHGPADRAAALAAKKKKLADNKPKAKDGSSGLSSAPASPPQRRRRVSNTNSKSDSETAPVESPKLSTKERLRPVEKLVPHKRKAPRPDSDDEAESRKVRRQRISGSGLDASRKSHQTHPPAKPHHDAHPSTRNRSISPHAARTHRRSISTTQLPGHTSNGLSHKKKRVPAPLQSTDYHSDESSASGSPHPRSSKLRSLTTPATTESTVSPAKMVPHKKHLDAHGQTFLARACAKGEYETAKHRLQERPEDINVADYAGNTPLQIAALNGFDDIVKLLVDAGCNLDCVNNDKDTPLLDAVENGHLEVVRILLAAGVNPRKANAYGQEPIDRVNEEMDHADEIRRALQDAKQKMGERRRTSEDHHPDHADARSSHGPESPRRSPGAVGSIHAASGRRAGTVRSTKTSNHLLYMPMDDKTLRAAAARGDEETVTRILQVRENFDDLESMVAAARGGHDIVMQLLLALGRANPDPAPQAANEFSTPMLAAIGQENIKVVRLLLDQNDFNPTRRIKGETYYEIARRRRGPNWAEEEHMLKDAFDSYDKQHKGDAKTRSPSKREQDRESRRSRPEAKEEAAKFSHKRKTSSPTRETREPKKPAPPKLSTSPKEKRRSNSFTAHVDGQTSPKRGPGRPRKDDRLPTIAISDREASPAGKQPTSKAKRAEPDLTAASSEGETVKPRRKLVSGRELKGERAQQNRRVSLTSTTSSLKEPSSPREEPEKSQKTEKYHDRTKALKRDESRDRLSVSGEGLSKRHRSSATPPHAVPAEKDALEGPAKRRRLDIDGKDRPRLKTGSSDDRRLKAPSSREPSSATAAGGPRIRSKSKDSEDRKPAPKSTKAEAAAEQGRRESGKSVSSENSIHVKSEDPDVDMPDADQAASVAESRAALQKEKEVEEKKKRAEVEAREAKKKEEERRRAEEKEKEKERLRLEEEAMRLAEVEARRREEEEKKRQEEEERRQKEEERKQRELEERRKKEEEEERLRQEEEERKRKEEEERKRREELERKRKLEEEKKRKEEEERRQKEEEKKRREEEERLRREQLEREAAEELRRKQEEERKEQERKQHQEMERRRLAREAERVAREAEQRRIRLEQERIRLAKLPPLLRWLDASANPKVPEIAERFRIVQGVRFDCIRPEATGTPEGREQWLLNTQVALLLGEKDLKLSRYTAWTTIPASYIAKRIIWRLESDRYSLTSPSLYELGKQLPDYYGADEPERMSYRVTEKLRGEAWKKFEAMDMFFVKASDFMYIVPTIHHLRSVKLTMEYRELPENEALVNRWCPLQKWKNDPDAGRNFGFAPGNKHFVNGELISEDRPSISVASSTPFPEKRVPRRGLVAVSPDDPAYAVLCKEQGLDNLLREGDSPLLPNGIRPSPMAPMMNGIGSPTTLVAAALNRGQMHGNHPISPSSETGPAQARPLVNGVNSVVNGSTD